MGVAMLLLKAVQDYSIENPKEPSVHKQPTANNLLTFPSICLFEYFHQGIAYDDNNRISF